MMDRSSWRFGSRACSGLVFLITSCGQSGGGGGQMTTSTPSTSALLADTNRDGVVDEHDRVGKSDWSASGGAIFLANLDDDDKKGAADASDQIVNGAEDEKDLARIELLPWPGASMSASATLSIDDPLAASSVNLFRHDGGSFSLVTLPATLPSADLAAGVHFGIEAKDFVERIDPASWNGYVVLHLRVNDPSRPGDAGALVDDSVKLRVAPFVMVNNLSTTAQIWNASPSDPGGLAFHEDLATMSSVAAAELDDASPPDDPQSPGIDQWDEDWWQVGITFMPAKGGPHGMRVAQRSAQPDRPAGGYAQMQLGPDFAFIWPHTPSKMGQTDMKAYSLDSFGNHDTLPPYSKGSDRYPLGRIIVGGTAAVHIDPVTRAFYDAQRVQPVVQVDTTWLLVGHIDEIMSYVPAKTPRGWKLLVASPRLARTMLQSLVAQNQGAVKMFVGKDWIDNNNKATPAAVTVSDLLADPEIMAANETVQMKIDAALAQVKSEVGLADDEVIEIPILFERTMVSETSAVDGYEFVAHMVGTVNLRAANGALAIPRPHGPQIAGSDFFETDLMDRLGSPRSGLGADGTGLKITFVEDWDDYHVADGEVHCGTTTGVTAMPAVRWWEAGR